MEGESGSARRSWARGDHERATRSEGERASQGTPRAGSRKQIAPPRRERGPGGGRRGLGRAERSARVAPFAPLMPFPASPRDPLLPGPAKGGAATGRRILRTYHRNPMRHERAVGQTSGDGAAEAARSQAPLRRSPLPRARTFPLPRSSHDHAQPLPSCRRLRRNPLLRSPSRSLSPSLGARMRRHVDFRSWPETQFPAKEIPKSPLGLTSILPAIFHQAMRPRAGRKPEKEKTVSLGESTKPMGSHDERRRT